MNYPMRPPTEAASTLPPLYLHSTIPSSISHVPPRTRPRLPPAHQGCRAVLVLVGRRRGVARRVHL